MKAEGIGGEALPGIARARVARALGAAQADAPEAVFITVGYLDQQRGVFVTIRHPHKGLRGCKGTIHALWGNLVEETRANALSAAFEDWRCQPVERAELDEVRFEVSVLGVLEPVLGGEDLDPERYGVVVSATDGRRRGLLLPGIPGIDLATAQVRIAREKAGIGGHEPVTLMRFEVDKFAEVE